MAPVVPAKSDVGEHKTTSVRLPVSMVQEIDGVATETHQSRNEVVVHLLRYALDAHQAEKKKAKK